MSRYSVTITTNKKSTRKMSHGSATSSSSSAATAQNAQNGGHCASPYLRRFRLPKLNTIRGYDMEVDDDDEDEWVEIQTAKNELINSRMRELQARLKEIDVNIKNNNNGGDDISRSRTASMSMSAASPSSSPCPSSSFSSSAAILSSSSFGWLTNANSCENIQRNVRQHNYRGGESMGNGETQTPFFHPKHLFASSLTTTSLKSKSASGGGGGGGGGGGDGVGAMAKALEMKRLH